MGTNIHLMVIDAQWSEASAEGAVRGWLRLKSSEGARVEVVAAQDDSMARGARVAIASLADADGRWTDIPFLGIDGVPEVGRRLVRDGELTATVVMPSNTGAALEVLGRWMHTGTLPLVGIELRASSFPVEGELERLVLRRRRTA